MFYSFEGLSGFDRVTPGKTPLASLFGVKIHCDVTILCGMD